MVDFSSSFVCWYELVLKMFSFCANLAFLFDRTLPGLVHKVKWRRATVGT